MGFTADGIGAVNTLGVEHSLDKAGEVRNIKSHNFH